jgi:murein DD-endopeptidase MepM/ murein hydrolase activator NlpD
VRRSARGIAAVVAVLAAVRVAAAGDLPPVPAPTNEPLEVQGERWARAVAAELHDPIGHYDPKRVAAEAKAAGGPNDTRALYFDRLAQAIGAAFYSFAPIGATPDPATRYRLPFELDTPRYLVQGANGPFTHQGVQAFDFAMPVGTPVLAARDGTVGRVRDGFREGGLDPRFRTRVNEVLVLHADGTFAQYEHLSPGISVHEGQAVKMGERIASSGSTGYAAGPHLHFSVSRRVAPASTETVPIHFGVGSKVGFVPEAGQFYGGQPNRNVELVVSAGGAPLSEQNPLRLAPGAKTALAVSLVAPGAAPADVTHAAATRFFTPTDWSLVVGADGTVVASPSADFAAAFAKLGAELKPPGSIDWGIVLVSYTEGGRNGFASVPVLVRGAARH